MKNENKEYEYTYEKFNYAFSVFKELKKNKEYGKLFLLVIESIGRFILGSLKFLKTTISIALVIFIIYAGIKVVGFCQEVNAFDGISDSIETITSYGDNEEDLSYREKYNHCVELIKNDSRFDGITEEELDEYAKKLIKIRYEQ